MSVDSVTSDDVRHELYEIMRQDAAFEEKADAALALAETYLDVENAHLTRIDQETSFWEALASTDGRDGSFPPGLTVDLDTTYCRRTIEADAPIALHNAPEQGWADDPAFQTHGLHCYLGITLSVDEDTFGTLCFVSADPRGEPFSDEEILFGELVARLLEHEVARSRYTAELERRETIMNVLGRVLRHNLRNDMTVVRGRLQLLAEEVTNIGEQVGQITETIDRLLALSETARTFESIDNNELERQPLELMHLLDQVIQQARVDYPSASVSLKGPDEVTVVAVPSVTTAFEELLENAMKHADPDPQVEIVVEKHSDTVDIHLSDNGPGLPEQEQAVLAARDETPLVHGSGLGLWIAQWIIQDQQGTITCDVDALGTTITVSLFRQADGVHAHAEETQIALERLKNQFHAVFEESNDAMVIADDEGRYLEVNPAAVKLFNTAEAELLGRDVTEYAPDDLNVKQRWQEFLDAGRQTGEFTVVRSDETTRTVEFNAVADILPGQHLSILRDITERKEMDRRSAAMLNNSQQCTGLLDPDGTVIAVNDPAVEFGGFDREAVLGQKLWQTAWFQHSTDTRDQAKQAVEHAAEGTFVRHEITVLGADEEMEIDFSLSPVTDDHGNVSYLVPEGRPIAE